MYRFKYQTFLYLYKICLKYNAVQDDQVKF